MANTQATFDGLRKGIAITPSSLQVNPMTTVEEGTGRKACPFATAIFKGFWRADGVRTDEPRDIF